jgi:hypothetical protein
MRSGRSCHERATGHDSDWKPLQRNTLRGFLTAHLPSGMNLHDISVHCRDGTWWASPASKPSLGADGTAMRDADGRIRYSPIVSFEKTARQRFSNAIIAALRLVHPEVFDDAEAL